MPDAVPMRSAPEPRNPLAGLRLSIVGPGRVGSTLASWATLRGARLVAVAARRAEPARRLAEPAGAAVLPLAELASADADLLLVAVAEGAIAEVAETLSDRPQAPVVLHTSGSLGASALRPLAEPRRGQGGTGAATGTFHPLKAFPRPLPEAEELERAAGTFYALEGAPEALVLGRRLAAAFDGVAGEVPEGVRDLYHLGATVAAGGAATLVVSAGDLVRGLGLPEASAEAIARGYVDLALGAIGALRASGAGASAVTGPLARGEHDTFLRELESLRRLRGPEDEALGDRLELLCRLGLETVRLTAGATEAEALRQALRRRGLRTPDETAAGAPSTLRKRSTDC